VRDAGKRFNSIRELAGCHSAFGRIAAGRAFQERALAKARCRVATFADLCCGDNGIRAVFQPEVPCPACARYSARKPLICTSTTSMPAMADSRNGCGASTRRHREPPQLPELAQNHRCPRNHVKPGGLDQGARRSGSYQRAFTTIRACVPLRHLRPGRRCVAARSENPQVNLAGIRRANLRVLLDKLSPALLSRQLRRLRDIGVIKRVGGTHRHHLTRTGRSATAALCHLTQSVLISALI
jgi:hypothetical protein